MMSDLGIFCSLNSSVQRTIKISWRRNFRTFEEGKFQLSLSYAIVTREPPHSKGVKTFTFFNGDC